MKRKLVAVLLVLLILSANVLCVSADAFIPPVEVPYDILGAYLDNDSCYALNVFLSNFVEVGLENYDQSTSDSQLIAAVLKHLEMNAKYFSGDVTRVDGNDGKTYMSVTEDIFNTRMQKLFGKKIPVSVCPGYENGSILVSADHFDGPIQVFASVYFCQRESDGVYRAFFNAYYVNQDFSGWHSTANRYLPTEKLTQLGKGEAVIRYTDYDTVSSISTSDFTLLEWSMDAEGIPCAGANLPYGVEETEPPTEAPTAAPTDAPTEAPTQPETVPELSVPDKDLGEETSTGISTGVLVLIVVLVVVVAILSLVIILLVIKKK